MIHIQNFLNKFSVSNSKKKQIKKLLIKGLSELEEFIEPRFLITKTNGSILEVKKLTLRSIKQAQRISFKEAIKIPKDNSINFDQS